MIESFAAKSEHAIGARTIVLPGNGCAKFHQLWGGKSLLQPLAQLRRDARGRGGEGVGQFQHQFLVAVKDIALLMPIQVANLLIAQSCRLTCGRVDVNSKRALNQFGGANLS